MLRQTGGQGGLSGARRAADEGERHLAGFQMGQRQPGVPVRLGGRGRHALGGTDAGHLRPDESPIGDVVMLQRCRRVGAAEFAVAVQEVLGQVGATEIVEIHGQECDVVEHVDEPQLVVELEAVQHSWMVGQAEDVLCDQVPVAVDDHPAGGAVGQQQCAAVDVPQRQLADALMQPRVHGGAEELLGLGEVVGPPVAQCGRATRGRDLRSTFGAGVEFCDRPGELTQVALDIGAPTNHRGQPQRLRHPAHDDDVFVDLSVGTGQGCDVEVHIGREPSIELEFPPADPSAGCFGAEVEEAEVDGLLELERTVADENHDSTVGFPDLGRWSRDDHHGYLFVVGVHGMLPLSLGYD